MIIAVCLIMVSTTFSAIAATVQPKGTEVVNAVQAKGTEVVNAVQAKASKPYPKSMQMKKYESAENETAKQILEKVSMMRDETVTAEGDRIFWKSKDGQKVEKVRVSAGKIDFQWTPVFQGCTWVQDLSMWSDGALVGREVTLYFLDKDGKTIWSSQVQLPKKLNKEDGETLVPPIDSMVQKTPCNEIIEVGVAPR